MSEEVQEGQLDRRDLKVMGYRQKLAVRDEEFNELQVDYTIVSEQLTAAMKEVERLNEIINQAGLNDEHDDDDEVPAGDVSED